MSRGRTVDGASEEGACEREDLCVVGAVDHELLGDTAHVDARPAQPTVPPARGAGVNTFELVRRKSRSGGLALAA
jgi:hypothetical protein